LIRRVHPRLVGEPIIEDGPGEGEPTVSYADEDELGPLANLAHAEEVIETIEYLRDPAFGLNKSILKIKPDRSFFASPGGRKTQRSISDERNQFLLNQLLTRLAASNQVTTQQRAATLRSFSTSSSSSSSSYYDVPIPLGATYID
jgi:hypothetical protein